ncbi:hypothetical protein PPYR_06852 [Photinus pyralis]|uniref:Uncharacterized protein n=2 Tax=Photinus pyralis TaxID=7054 RepID=A0A5N4ANP6_PHOPY|nr:hypothetical protein PPYR_06852 [Photinus pyralis]
MGIIRQFVHLQHKMYFFAFAVLCVAVANAGVIPGAIVETIDGGAIVQGPSSSTAVHGPDGSVIAADAPGGTVIAAPKSAGVVAVAPAAAVVAHAAPLIAAPAHIIGAPLIAHSSPLIARAHLGYPLLAPGSGLEGQYVHDYTETLYDNGQYHGEIYH